MGFGVGRVWGLGFEVLGLGFGVYRVWMLEAPGITRFGVQWLEAFRDQSVDYKTWGSGIGGFRA